MLAGFLSFLDPLSHVSEGHYATFLSLLFATVFRGLGAKILSVTFFIVAFWMLIRRESVQAFISFLMLSLFFAYFGWMLGVVF